MPTGTIELGAGVRSLITWMGSKRMLAKTLCVLLPEHKTYVEAFGGAGWVLFGKEPSEVEVYNDLDGRLIALFRSVKWHAGEFVRELDLLLPSRELFDSFRCQPGLTEIQRAARFYYVLQMSYGAKAETYGTWKTRPPRFRLETAMARVEEIRERLTRVTIEHDDFEVVLRRYDLPGTVFYLDPPYWESEPYKVPFTADDHARLRATLGDLCGRWLMTYNDHPHVRSRYEAFHRYHVEAPYILNRWQPGHQLIITNYRLTRAQLKAAPRQVTPIPKPRRRPKPAA